MDKAFDTFDIGTEFLNTITLENIPPVPKTDLYLEVTLIKKKKGRSVRTFYQSDFFPKSCHLSNC
jgi:hypothetical protein